MENPIEMDDLGVSLFLETSISNDSFNFLNCPCASLGPMAFVAKSRSFLIQESYGIIMNHASVECPRPKSS